MAILADALACHHHDAPILLPPHLQQGQQPAAAQLQAWEQGSLERLQQRLPSREVALQFAGVGGLLLRLDLLQQSSQASNVRALSALRAEEDASHSSQSKLGEMCRERCALTWVDFVAWRAGAAAAQLHCVRHVRDAVTRLIRHHRPPQAGAVFVLICLCLCV